MNSTDFGFSLKHHGVLGWRGKTPDSYIAQWDLRVPVERAVDLVWNTLNRLPAHRVRWTDGGNTIIEDHPDLPFRSTVLFRGRLSLAALPPVSQSIRITRVGGW